MIYLIGSLRNPRIPEIAKALRIVGHDIWDDWFAAGEFADDAWRDYEKGRGHDFAGALAGEAAKHVLAFDRTHLDACDAAILVMPAGKSGHLELGYVLGQGKPGYILLDGEPERYDVMAGLATGVATSLDALKDMIASKFDVNAALRGKPTGRGWYRSEENGGTVYDLFGYRVVWDASLSRGYRYEEVA